MNTFTELDVEREIQAKGKTAPRLTPGDIDKKIVGAKFWQPEGTSVTICLLSLENGFQVHGYSASASPENFDKEIGESIAFRNAREKIWQLEGYLLREKLSKPAPTEPNDWLERIIIERNQLLDRMAKLNVFLNKPGARQVVGEDQYSWMVDQHVAMSKYFEIIDMRIYSEEHRRKTNAEASPAT